MIHREKSRLGFSLVELSIVLVILGLLVGGILSGQSMIRAAELRSVSTDLKRYEAAVYTFRDKYFSLPGDMANATTFWGTAGGTGTDSTCFNTVSTTTATCNGDGDTTIEPAVTGYLHAEEHRAWQQLANAGLIEGGFTGAANYTTLGTHVPRSRISNAGFDFMYGSSTTYYEVFSSSAYGNSIGFGVSQSNSMRGAAIKPEEAWNLDTKLDDGKPDAGRLQLDIVYATTCHTGTFPTATFDLTNSATACALRYLFR